MKREDIRYLNSWAKSFGKASPALMVRGLLEGIWVYEPEDPEDVFFVYPELSVKSVGGMAEVGKKFDDCPFEFTYEYEGLWDKGREVRRRYRRMRDLGVSWAMSAKDMHEAVIRRGLETAKWLKISEAEVKALFDEFGWDDAKAYEKLMETRPDLAQEASRGGRGFALISESEYKFVRAAFFPHTGQGYSWEYGDDR